MTFYTKTANYQRLTRYKLQSEFSLSLYPEGIGWDSYDCVCQWVCLSVGLMMALSTIISLSSSSLSTIEEGSSWTCVGAVPRDLSLYDILSEIRLLLLHSNTVCYTIISVERCSLGNTSLHRDKMTPPLQEYSSVLYYTYYTIQNVSHDSINTKLDRFMCYTTFWPPMSANS